MSEYDPQYPALEVAISLENSPDLPDHERKKEGDIMGLRPIGTGGVGIKETKTRLWLRIEGLEVDQLRLLGATLEDPTPDGPTYEKRRYCIPLERLQDFDPALDLDRLRDPNDAYQPYLTLDGDDYTFLTEEIPLEATGLVFDKYIGDYL